MKNILIKSIAIFLFLSFIGISCKKEKTETPVPIVSELPILYQGCNLKEGKTVAIENQIGFDTVFNKNEISQISTLQNIDFSKYEILMGADVFTRGINKLDHYLTRNNDSEYIYTVTVHYDLTLPAGTFYYGIIVDRLPSNAIVDFVVKKLNY
jgi:hypothetical protein